VYFHTRQLDSNTPRTIHPHLSQFLSCDTGAVPGLTTNAPTDICPLCEGSGLRIVQKDGRQFAETCDCQVQRRATRRVQQAHIPCRYEHCSLDNYETQLPSSHRSLAAAHLRARKFVDSYPIETAGTGLLITGSIGVGKTHLAVGILQALVAERGATGLFVDYRDLLKQVQNSYNRQVSATELEILAPVFEAEVLVIDELGASKPTDWVWDTVAHILNTRYNDRRTTIITTNYSNVAPLGIDVTNNSTRIAMREETLGDRIGERMRSRLQEMCVVVEMQGEDFRQKIKRASFA
jgi:DNA replication protein DnaC